MLGEFVDDYTVRQLMRGLRGGIIKLIVQISCVDVFAMPQSGTTVTVESVDHVFQTKMLDMLKQTGRSVYHFPMMGGADGQARNGCGMVPLASRIRLLAL